MLTQEILLCSTKCFANTTDHKYTLMFTEFLSTAREGYVFRSVGQSLCPGGMCLPRGKGMSAYREEGCIQRVYLLGSVSRRRLPTGGFCLQRGVCLQGVVCPTPPCTDIYWRPLQRLVRILPEYILVRKCFSIFRQDCKIC